ncbi:MAG: DUF4143 domain-containing protein, partial [Nanoarchaeota archaeon]
LQIRNEVSYKELSDRLGIDVKTVERYIYLLEKSFVVFRLPPYRHNRGGQFQNAIRYTFLIWV